MKTASEWRKFLDGIPLALRGGYIMGLLESLERLEHNNVILQATTNAVADRNRQYREVVDQIRYHVGRV